MSYSFFTNITGKHLIETTLRSMVYIGLIKMEPSIPPVFFLVFSKILLLLEEYCLILSKRKLGQEVLLWQVQIIVLEGLKAIVLLVE